MKLRLRPACAALAAGLALACVGSQQREQARIGAALSDLRLADRVFDVDVRFARNPSGVCDGVACARVEVIDGRRTIQLAPEAFHSDAKLRASLLEIWERYREPRIGSVRDLARGALRILTDGERAGVDDPLLLRRTWHSYQRSYLQLSAGEREGLPNPESVRVPGD